jgi:hypothetical protein
MAVLMIAIPGYTADPVKLSAFTTGTTVADTDYLLYLYYTGGQYYNRKITMANLKSVLQPLDATLTAIAAQTESQGALQYYTADATPAVLAKGTAYQLLQMNSGATAPEWASSLSISALNLTSATSSIPWVVSATTPATFNLDGMAYYESDVYKLFIRDQTNTRNLAFIPEGIATGGLIFGDDSPDAAGEIGYDGELKYYDAVGSKTVATVKVEKLAVFNIDGTAADNTVIDSYIPVASTITGAIITTTGTACSAVVDIWSDTYANFPATNDDSIVASAPPTLSTATAAKPTITTWEKSIPADSVLRANLDSSDCTGVIQVTLIGTK